MNKWTVEADSDTIATIELHHPVLFTPERTCRVVKKTADLDGERMTDYTCCFNQPGWNNNFCPNCGAKVVSDAD
jgi:hypothetical protein